MAEKKHKWTHDDDVALEAAINLLLPLMAHFREAANRNESNWWDAVAGRLAPGLLVTGGACRCRWAKIRENRAADEAKKAERVAVTEPDAWAAAAERIEEYERSLSEHTLDRVDLLVDAMTALCAKVDRLCDAWGVK
jgi:hypothetical protein